MIWHEAQLEQAFQYCITKPDELPILSEALRKIQEGFFSWNYLVNFIQDSSKKDYYDLKDALVFTECHTRLLLGEVGRIEIDLPVTPLADKDVEGNNKLLTLLPDGFYGEFWGGNKDSDGVVGWDKTWQCCVQKVDESNILKTYLVDIEPNEIELEVGSISRGKMPYYLSECSHGVARWPHGSNIMTLFVSKKLFTGELVAVE